MPTRSLILDAAGDPIACISNGCGPIIALALHGGHQLRSEIAESLVLAEEDRRREEDPATASMAPRGLALVEVLRSRFEVDLNRPRERAVYEVPDDAWGLELYSSALPEEAVRASRQEYDEFYGKMFDLLGEVEKEYGGFVVLDIHSYNHRRDGADAASAPVAENPEVNLGTARLDRERWAPVIDAFLASMRDEGFDCRENVKFGGGHFAHWVAENFGRTGAVLAIEFKKTYMDEWTGRVDEESVARNRSALETATAAITNVLASMTGMRVRPQ